MRFLDKLLHKKRADFDDPAFNAGLPPLQDATTENTQGAGTSEFTQTGIPSSGVASFMEKSGDDLTELSLMSGGEQSNPQNPLLQSSASHQEMPQSKGQQLAHHYMQQQQPTQQAPLSSERSSAHSLELIDVKLDAIRSELSVIAQRLEKLEQAKKW